jgi:peptidoglycan/xylan/chitin deacetylase (PgdA/CDA1 family)
MYHSVDDSSDRACVRPQRFEEQIAYLKKAGYHAVNLDAVYSYLTGETSLPTKIVVITFDDGFRDNMENAYPVLKRYGMCFTIFLPTDHIGLSNRWNAAEGVPQRQLLTWEEIRLLANDPLVCFSAHSCSHPKLTHIPVKQVRDELSRSKKIIEDHLSRQCYHMAYPYGDFNEAVCHIAMETGFHTACTMRWGHNRSGCDLFALYRIGISNQDRLSDFKRVIGEPLPIWKYYWKRIKAKLNG